MTRRQKSYPVTTTMKREGELKSAAMRELKQQCPSWLVLEQATAGAPDRLIAGNGKITGWEFKHATPDFTSKGNQELFCLRLDALGVKCRYVFWQEGRTGLGARTMIVHPRDVHERIGCYVKPETFCMGFNHKWLVEQIRAAHGL